MKILSNGWLSFDSWHKVLEDNDTDNLYSDRDVFDLCNICKYLFRSLRETMIHCHNKSFSQCIEIAIKSISDIENSELLEDDAPTITVKTVLRWYSIYNKNGYFPNKKKINGRVLLPTLLDSNPDVKEAITVFCNDNLATLSRESLHQYIINKCLPSLLETRCKE